MKKKTVIPVIIILIILGFVYLFKNDLKNMFIPIYKVVDRTSNVEKFKQEHTDEEVAGWIKIGGTNIDYPILVNDDAYYYIDTIRDYNYAWINSKLKDNYNYIPIYGHNVRNVSKNPIVGDKSMIKFEQLMSFIYYDFDKENKYFQITIDGKNYLYEIFSVGVVKEVDLEPTPKKMSKDDLASYIEKSLNDSMYKFDVEVDANDKIISLITCTRINGDKEEDFKVDGKLVKNKNIGYNYNVDKKDDKKLGSIDRGEEDV